MQTADDGGILEGIKNLEKFNRYEEIKLLGSKAKDYIKRMQNNEDLTLVLDFSIFQALVDDDFSQTSKHIQLCLKFVIH